MLSEALPPSPPAPSSCLCVSFLSFFVWLPCFGCSSLQLHCVKTRHWHLFLETFDCIKDLHQADEGDGGQRGPLFSRAHHQTVSREAGTKLRGLRLKAHTELSLFMHNLSDHPCWLESAGGSVFVGGFESLEQAQTSSGRGNICFLSVQGKGECRAARYCSRMSVCVCAII